MNIYNDFIKYIYNNSNDYILNGVSALVMGYNLDRVTNKIFLDAPRGCNNKISELIINYCDINDLEYVQLKNTNSLEIFIISNEISIEIRFIREINYDNVININNLRLYNINRLANSINTKFSVHNDLEDFYDLIYIIKYYWDELSDYTKGGLVDAFTFNGINYYLDIIENNYSNVIDKDLLKDEFTSIYDKLEL